MQNRELFKWTFVASGLWLILSPFLFLDLQSVSSKAATGDAGPLITMGLLALIVAGYGVRRHDLERAYFGFVVGLLLLIAPWVGAFSETIASWNAGIVGTLLALVALYRVYQHKSGHSVS